MSERSFWNRVLDLFQESIIIQSTITLVIMLVTGFMVVTSNTQGLPEQWWQIVMLIVGYWVGSKGNFASAQANRRTLQTMEKMADAFGAAATAMGTSSRDCEGCEGGD